MRVKKFPKGYFDFSDGILTICEPEVVSIGVQDIRSVICREGRKILLSHSPYGVFECVYQNGLQQVRCKQLFRPAEMPAMQALCELINISRVESETV
jgi:hypothetical protein